MEWGEFITKNRPMIDEFIGPNHEKYIEIALKGQLMKKIGKEKAFQSFEKWEEKNFTSRQKNKLMREILALN